MNRPGVPYRKYAALFAPQPGGLPIETELVLSNDVSARVAKLRDLISPVATKMWREAFGTLKWSEIEHESLVVWASRPSTDPSVNGEDTVELCNVVEVAWEALQYVDFCMPFAGDMITLHGKLASVEPLSLESADGWQSLPPTIQPFYCKAPEFLNAVIDTPVTSDWQADWQAKYRLLQNLRLTTPPLLQFGRLAFDEGQRAVLIEFRIPHFVRAAESVLGLPPGTGAEDFSRRALAIAPELTHERFLAGWNIEERLEHLYDIRSQCVHGRLPFEKQKGVEQEVELEKARYEYLAERIARKALLHGLRMAAEPSVFEDRETLCKAWDDGRVAGLVPRAKKRKR